jgi:hypothetical protein
MKMNKKYLLAFGITLLVLGVGIQPAIATVTPTKTVDFEPKDYLFQTIMKIANNPDVKDIQSLLEKYQVKQKEITAIIKDKDGLNRLKEQLSDLPCDCENDNTTRWGFPILCSILNVLMIIPLILFVFGSSLGSLGLWFRFIGLIGYVIVMITVPIIYAIINVGTIFDCNWWFIST